MSSVEIINVQVKVPLGKHKAAQLKMIESDDVNEKSFQKLLMRAIDSFIGVKKKKKDKNKKRKLRK